MYLANTELFEVLRRVPSLFTLGSVLLFGDVVAHSGETIFILVQSPRLVPATLFPCGFYGVHVHHAVNHKMMVPPDFRIGVVLCDVYVSCRRQPPLFPLIVEPPDVVLHILDCLIHGFRFFAVSVG